MFSQLNAELVVNCSVGISDCLHVQGHFGNVRILPQGEHYEFELKAKTALLEKL